MADNQSLYGLLAEFDGPDRLLNAARRSTAAGYTCHEAFTPFPIDGLRAALGPARRPLPGIVLIAGVIGAVVGYAMQYYLNVIDYPLNVGGRTMHSWPAFLVVALEVAVLFAALAAALGMLALNGLPRPHHPLFEVPEFAHASNDGFFLCIRANDPQFDATATRRFLNEVEPAGVWEVPGEPSS